MLIYEIILKTYKNEVKMSRNSKGFFLTKALAQDELDRLHRCMQKHIIKTSRTAGWITDNDQDGFDCGFKVVEGGAEKERCYNIYSRLVHE